MGAPSHDRLLALVREAQAAAGGADARGLAEDLALFVDALTGHLVEEGRRLNHLPLAEARLLRRGQAQLWATTGSLLHDARTSCAAPSSRCVSRLEELLALVGRQVRNEDGAFDGLAMARHDKR